LAGLKNRPTITVVGETASIEQHAAAMREFVELVRS